MYNPVKTLQDFTNSIAGMWVNPETKNKYFFTPNASDASKGEVDVLQHGADASIPLNIALKMKEERVVITVEGAEYEVSLSGMPLNALTITLSPGNVVHLLKG